jgi:hypothetical protein
MAIGNQQFAGFITLDESLVGSLLVTNASTGAPVNADSLPTFRVYGPSSFLVSGSCTLRDSGSITGATNASPIVITSASHGLTTGARATISGVGGNTAANGTFTITKVDANSFSLNGSTGNGTYTSGGTWNVTGLYKYSIDATGANGFDVTENYQINFTYEVSSTVNGQTHSFQVS